MFEKQTMALRSDTDLPMLLKGSSKQQKSDFKTMFLEYRIGLSWKNTSTKHEWLRVRKNSP